MFLSCSTSTDLQWNKEEGYRWAEVEPGFFGSTGFESLPSSQTNIDFNNHITEEELSQNRHYLNGSGVAAGDVDGDGLADLYFAGLKRSNRLYKNLGGMQFEDITDRAGVAHEEHYSTGAVFSDIDGDDDLDLLVTSIYKNNALYINDGAGNFELNKQSGLGPGRGSTSMALADIDGDKDLDLYIARYKEKSVKDIYTTQELAWNNILNEPYNQQQQTGPYTLTPPFDQHYEIFMTDENRLAGLAETGEVDELYLNEEGSFKKVEDTRNQFLDEDGEPYGLQEDWGLTAKFQDLNGDGLPDLYVCNDFFTKDKVWINQGKGIFKAIEWSAIRNLSFACMGVDFSDINRDGEMDIFTAEMLSPEHDRRLQQVGSEDPDPDQFRELTSRPTYNRNSMYLKREDLTYAEIAYLSGVEGTGWSWDATFLDVDLNGYEDLLVNNGYLYHILDMDAQVEMMRKGRNMDEHFTEFMRNAPSLELRNRAFMNNGDLTFREVGRNWGFEEQDISHGMATADLNNDGALDLALNRMNSEAGIYENRTNKPRIAVRLKGRAPNTRGIGAVIRLQGGPSDQKKEVSAGGDFLSGSDAIVMFAADSDNADHRLTVTWPDGSRTRIDSLKSNRIYEIDESRSTKEPVTTGNTAEADPIFREVSELIDHQHHENSFDDFGVQSLLPYRLSQFGPGISWMDIDGDRDDDLFISTGKGGTIGAFENIDGETFQPINTTPFVEQSPGDLTAVIGWSTEEGANFVIGSSNYEQGSLKVPSAFRYRFQGKEMKNSEALPDIYSSTGTLAMADYDGDGDLDLFIAGRFIPAHYPQDATSRLFVNEQGSFVKDEVNSRKLSEIGLVTGAVFTDYDQDGDQDLLLSREWDSIILMENRDGVFNDISERAGLSGHKGWWNSLATGDFNNDGQPDIIATNWGLNSPYQLRDDKPLRMYYEDFNGDIWVDIIEAYANSDGEYVPRKKLFNYESVPEISYSMRSHEQFANATLRDLFGEELAKIPQKEINTLQHTLFLNKGNVFEARPLPVKAQFSASFHAGVADVDNDGNEDLYLGQNFFAVPGQVPRHDAGRGLLLLGNGEGNLSPVSGTESGLKIYGGQRGAAFSDFNSDGKVDIAVTQNSAETRLYRNQTEKRGYRINLTGPPVNNSAVGSSLRMIYVDGEKGPRREIQAGSGHWSQNSYTQIMGTRDGVTVQGIEVTWPDGSRQTVPIQDGKMEYDISYPGGE